MRTPPRVLVTGERGFLGTALCARLQQDQDGFNLVRPRSATFRAKADSGWTVDIRNWEQVLAAVAEVDVVVHMAARKGSWFCDEDIADTINVNLLGTARVAKACVQLGRPLLHFGTTAYYHSTEIPVLLGENSAMHPQTVYGLTKLYAERTLCQYEGLKWLVVRPVYGYGNIGPFAASRSESWMDVVLREIRQGRTEPLQTDLGGEFIKDYTHVSDIVEVTVQLLDLLCGGDYGFTVQVGAGGNYRFGELMSAFVPPFEVLYDEGKDYKKHQPHDYHMLRQVLPYWKPQVDALEYARARGEIWVG